MKALVHQRRSLVLTFRNLVEIFKFKDDNTDVNFATQFRLGLISTEFFDSPEKCHEKMSKYYSVDYNTISQSFI